MTEIKDGLDAHTYICLIYIHVARIDPTHAHALHRYNFHKPNLVHTLSLSLCHSRFSRTSNIYFNFNLYLYGFHIHLYGSVFHEDSEKNIMV
jgi:hypothetical protein